MMTSRIVIAVFIVLFLSFSGIGPIDGTTKDLQTGLTDELISRQDRAGTWGLGHYLGSPIETTSWSLIYLCGLTDTHLSSTGDGVAFLLDSQNQDGGWGTSPGMPSGVQTAYALMALKKCFINNYPEPLSGSLIRGIEAGDTFLVSHRENHTEHASSGGWGWTPDTYDFAEPSAYGLMAGLSGLDIPQLSILFETRRCADGGWDIEKHNTSRIIPTSVVLVGIRGAGVPISDVNGTLDLLEDMAQERETPLSLCWANYALGSYGRDTAYIEEQIRDKLNTKIDSYTLAICLLSLEDAHG